MRSGSRPALTLIVAGGRRLLGVCLRSWSAASVIAAWIRWRSGTPANCARHKSLGQDRRDSSANGLAADIRVKHVDDRGHVGAGHTPDSRDVNDQCEQHSRVEPI